MFVLLLCLPTWLLFLALHKQLQTYFFAEKDRLRDGLSGYDLLWLGLYYSPLTLASLAALLKVWIPKFSLRTWLLGRKGFATLLRDGDEENGKGSTSPDGISRTSNEESIGLPSLGSCWTRRSWAERRKMWGFVVSPADACLGIGLLVLNLIWIVSYVTGTYVKYHSPNPFSTTWALNLEIISRGLAFPGICNIGLAILLAVRNLHIARAAGLTYEHGIPYHMITGWAGLFYISLHSILFMIVYTLKSEFVKHLFTPTGNKRSFLNLAGFIGWIALLAMFFTSLERVRRHYWWLFVYGHQASIIFVLCGLVHSSAILRYLSIPLLTYTVSTMASYLHAKYMTKHTTATFQNVTSSMTRITFLLGSGALVTCQPRSWISICVPVADHSSHPFSIVTYGSTNRKQLVIFVRSKTRNGWCGKLWRAVKDAGGGPGPGSGTSLTGVELDVHVTHISRGNHSQEQYLGYNIVMLVACGTGLAAVLPIVEHIVKNSEEEIGDLTSVHLVWIVRDLEEVSAFAPFLSSITDNPRYSRHCSLTVYESGNACHSSGQTNCEEEFLEAVHNGNKQWVEECQSRTPSNAAPNTVCQDIPERRLMIILCAFTFLGQMFSVTGFILGRIISATIASSESSSSDSIVCSHKHAGWSTAVYFKCYCSVNLLPMLFSVLGIGVILLATSWFLNFEKISVAGKYTKKKEKVGTGLWKSLGRMLGIKRRRPDLASKNDFNLGQDGDMIAEMEEWLGLQEFGTEGMEGDADTSDDSINEVQITEKGEDEVGKRARRSVSQGRYVSTEETRMGESTGSSNAFDSCTPSFPTSSQSPSSHKETVQLLPRNLRVYRTGRPELSHLLESVLDYEDRHIGERTGSDDRVYTEKQGTPEVQVAVHAAGPVPFVDGLREACSQYDRKRGVEESMERNGRYRIDFYRESWEF